MKKLITTILLSAFLGITSTLFAAEPGTPAPDFTLKDPDDIEFKLSEHADKIVVLEWINYECPFVKKFYSENHLPAMQEKYTAKGVVWVAINSGPEGKQGNFDPDEMRERAVVEGSAAAFVLLDRDGKVGKAYKATNTPQMVVIDKGTIVYNGAIDDKPSTDTADIADAKNYVAAALDAVLAGKEVETKKVKPYGCGVKY